MYWEEDCEKNWRSYAVALGLVALGFGFVALGPLMGWAELHVTHMGRSPLHWLGQGIWVGAFAIGLYLLLVWPIAEWLLPHYQWNGPVRVLVTAFLWAVPLVSFVYYLTNGGVYDVGELLWIVVPWALVSAMILEGSGSPAVATVALAGGIVASVKGVHDAIGPFAVFFNYMALSPRFYVLRESFSLLALAATALLCLRHWSARERLWAVSGGVSGVGVFGLLAHPPVGVGMIALLGFLWLPLKWGRWAGIGIAALGVGIVFVRPAPVPALSTLAVLAYAGTAVGLWVNLFAPQAGDSNRPPRVGSRGSLRDG